MSAELVAIIAAAVSLGGVTLATSSSLRSAIGGLDTRLRAVETELAYLRGLLQSHGIPPAPSVADPEQTEGAA